MGLDWRSRLVGGGMPLREDDDDVCRCPIRREEAVSSQKSRRANTAEATLTDEGAGMHLASQFRLRDGGIVLW